MFDEKTYTPFIFGSFGFLGSLIVQSGIGRKRKAR